MTLVDTPGQEIFYRMRNYGAGVADMALLLVALNDGVCNQTQESIGALEDMSTLFFHYKLFIFFS